MRSDFPRPGSEEERDAYHALQGRIPELYHALSTYPRMRQTVVVIPSLSLDPRELEKISGAHHYEERMLVNLMILRRPRVKLIFVTSTPIDPVIIDYYLSMIPGVPVSQAARRLVLLHCADASSQSLTGKILARPRLVERIRREILDPERAHMVCFNSTPAERSLAVQLGIPMNSVDPDLHHLGTKSGCREIFRESGIVFPFGFERLRTHRDIAKGLAEILRHDPTVRRAAVKLDEGFSGEGNAVFRFDGLDPTSSPTSLEQAIYDALPTSLRFEAPQECWETYSEKFHEMQGVVEAWVEGEHKASPSAQCRVNAIGEPQVISTHDQVLGGPSGQVFLGCTFPAADGYRLDIQASAAKVARVLADRGVIGRFAIDYVSVPTPKGWEHHAIEINLRKGGTTHPFLTLKFLTDGALDPTDGLFYAQSGRAKYYYASDTIEDPRYRGLRPEDLMEIVAFHGLHFHRASERGVVFHLIGALSEFGKCGVVAIGDNPKQARFLYEQTLEVLDEETGPDWHPTA